MKIKLTKQYKALTPFETPVLPRLVVLTGKNGSGKSQLLELLNFKDPSIPANRGRNAPQEAQSIGFEGFTPTRIKLTTFGSGGPVGLVAANKGTLDQLDKALIGQIQNFKNDQGKNSTHEFRTLAKICKEAKIEPSQLNQSHIKNHRYSGEDFEVKDIFTANLSQIIINYFENFHKNLELTVAKKSYGKDVQYYEKKEFEEKFPNPFKIINNVLETARIDYRLKEEKVENYYSTKSYDPVFLNTKSGASVKINDFSSGEKVLLSLAFSVLNTKEYSTSILPNLLLLDEIDASLHPSMVKQLLDVIEKQLIEKHDIHVILTTHSPSTIALAPEESIFLLKKFGEEGNRFVKINKRSAINQLLDGVRTIDIDTSNSKHVFTEARNDQYFYKSIYSALRNNFDPDVHLEFISSGVNDGDCELVKAMVSKLRAAGNNRIFGIIDWDQSNGEEDGLYVHSLNEMYSLENVVLSPLFLGLLLLHENFLHISEIFAGENRPYYEFFKSEINVEVLSQLARHVEEKVFTSTETVEVELINEFKIKLNKEYLEYQGHDLESLLKDKFPQLKKFNNEGKILKESIDKIIQYFPEFLSKKVVDSLLKIQNFH